MNVLNKIIIFIKSNIIFTIFIVILIIFLNMVVDLIRCKEMLTFETVAIKGNDDTYIIYNGINYYYTNDNNILIEKDHQLGYLSYYEGDVIYSISSFNTNDYICLYSNGCDTLLVSEQKRNEDISK